MYACIIVMLNGLTSPQADGDNGRDAWKERSFKLHVTYGMLILLLQVCSIFQAFSISLKTLMVHSGVSFIIFPALSTPS